MKDLTKGNIGRLILSFALPVFIGNILQLPYNLVDTKIVSQVLGGDALAAVGATNSMSSLVIGLLIGLANGFAVIAAQYFGAKDQNNLRRCVAMSLGIGIAFSLVLTLFVLLGLKPFLRILNTPEEILSQSYDYIFIIFAGMTGLMVYNICCAILRAIGDTITPLLFLFVSVILNVGGDYLFMVTFGWGVKGAAYATILAQFIAMALCVWYMFKRYEILRFGRRELIPDSKMVRNLIGTGLSMGFMNAFVAIGSVALQSGINQLGTDIIVAHTAARKITEIFMLIFSVLGTTMATFCGQNLGAGRIDRIKKGIRISIGIAWIWNVGVIILSYTVVPHMVGMLASTDNRVVIENASRYLKIDTLLYFVTAMITILRNSLQGIGDRYTPIISSMIELIGKVVIVIWLVPRLQYMGIILAEPIVWVLMVIPLIVQILRNPVLRSGKTE